MLKRIWSSLMICCIVSGCTPLGEGRKIGPQSVDSILERENVTLEDVHDIFGQPSISDTDSDSNIVEYYIARKVFINFRNCDSQDLFKFIYDKNENLLSIDVQHDTHNNIRFDSTKTEFNITEPTLFRKMFLLGKFYKRYSIPEARFKKT